MWLTDNKMKIKELILIYAARGNRSFYRKQNAKAAINMNLRNSFLKVCINFFSLPLITATYFLFACKYFFTITFIKNPFSFSPKLKFLDFLALDSKFFLLKCFVYFRWIFMSSFTLGLKFNSLHLWSSLKHIVIK